MHDGDKITQAYLDFITDESVKLKTLNNMLFEYQVKNQAFGDWNEASGNYSKIKGYIFDKNANLIDLEKVENPMEFVTEHLGLTAEQLSMRTRMLYNYNFAVEGRAYKELAKHYNSIYEIMTQLDDFAFDPKSRLDKDDLDRLEKVIKFSSDGKHHGININAEIRTERDIEHAITVGSKYARKNIENSLAVVNMLRSGKTDIAKFKKSLKGMDLIGATALFHILRGNKDDYETLLKKTHKEVDKFISRGKFDKFYSYKSSTGVFDELSGIRNTGKTHSYATKLRVTGVEVSKINVEKFISKLGSYSSEKINPEEMREMIRKQSYYTEASDIFFDNMIESAISAKHGLTLGGLEGSKLFINSMLSSSGKTLNDKMIRMFDEVFVKNNNDKMIEIADNLLEFNTGFRSFDKTLESVIESAEAKGLNKELLLKSFDFDDDYYKTLLKKDKISPSKIESYLEHKNMYLDELSKVEDKLYDLVKKNKKLSPLDFEAYKGLHLFGELMIQNDPNAEYEIDTIKDLISKYKSKELSIEELVGNYEFKKFKSQLYTTLGTSASISNVGNLREHIKVFNRVTETNKISNEFFDIASSKFDIDRDKIAGYFNSKLEMKAIDENAMDMELYKGLEKLSKSYADKLKKSIAIFSSSVERDPVSAYASAINRNVTDFTTHGKSGEKSLEILENYRRSGVPSINDSLLSEGIESLEELRNNRISEIALHYSAKDSKFSNLILDEGFSKVDVEVKNGMIKQANKVVDELTLKGLRENLRVIPISEIDSPGIIQMIHTNNINKLTPMQKELEELGVVKTFDGNVSKLDTEIFNSNNKFYFGRTDLFSNRKTTKEFMELYEKNPNIYMSEGVANTVLKTLPEYADDFIGNEEGNRIAEELILANLHLKEEINLKNAMKRAKGDFDYKLATRIKVSDFIDENPEFLEMKRDKKLFNNFKIRLTENLEGILSDYSKLDKNLKTSYVDDYYLNLAHTFTSENKKYIKVDEVLKDKTVMNRFKKYREAIERVLTSEKQWLNDYSLDEDLFKKVSTMELINRIGEVNDEYDLNKIMLNTAKAITGHDVEERIFEFAKHIKGEYKNGLVAKTAIGIAGLLGAASFIRKFIGGTKPLNLNNGTYVLGRSSENLTEHEVMDQLRMGNNKRTPFGIAELIEGINIPEYISIIKHKYF